LSRTHSQTRASAEDAGAAAPASAAEKHRPEDGARGPAREIPALAGGIIDAEERIRVDGKFFAAEGERFQFNGVTYGTFAVRADGALFPPRRQIERDLAAMREVGFNVVRTYTLPSDDILELAAE
jgi:hypothetical protein